MAFEYAEKIHDEAARKAAMTFVIIGGGPTGVEMAGAIAEISRYTLARDFRHINPSLARVLLVEADPRVLASFPEDLQISATKQLADLGVEVRTGVRATNLCDAGLQLGDEFIPCRVKIWAAGNTASFLGKTLGVAVDRVAVRLERVMDYCHRLGVTLVTPVVGDLLAFLIKQPAAPRCFACGDAAGSPRRAQHFKHDRRQTAALLVLGQGQHGTIGRNKAVADLNYVHFSGLPAWVVWLFVHVLFLVGFRNRFAVLFQWAWAYLTFNKGARLITRNFQSETRPPV
jgi:NADH dehydrogenase